MQFLICDDNSSFPACTFQGGSTEAQRPIGNQAKVKPHRGPWRTKRTWRTWRSGVHAALILVGTVIAWLGSCRVVAYAQALTAVPFDGGEWNFMQAPEAVTVSGRSGWRITGMASVKNVDLRAGSFEVDVASVGGFAGLVFHVASDQEYERFYLRLGSSGAMEAIQYVPSFRGFSAWRIYPEDQATAEYGPWVHVRVDFTETLAAITVNKAAQPNLVVRLAHPEQRGFIGVGTPGGEEYTFANFAFSNQAPTIAPPPETSTNVVRQWQMSKPLPVSTSAYPAAADLQNAEWMNVQADHRGLVDVPRFRGTSSEPVVARFSVNGGTGARRTLQFGFCDEASLFLNGERVFQGTLPLQEGGQFLRIRDNAITLNLRPGDNEVLAVVAGDADRSEGGWGFRARWSEPSDGGAGGMAGAGGAANAGGAGGTASAGGAGAQVGAGGETGTGGTGGGDPHPPTGDSGCRIAGTANVVAVTPILLLGLALLLVRWRARS